MLTHFTGCAFSYIRVAIIKFTRFRHYIVMFHSWSRFRRPLLNVTSLLYSWVKCRHHKSYMLRHWNRGVRHFSFLNSWFQVDARLTRLWHNTTSADATAPVLPAQIPPAHKYPISRSIPPALNLVYRPRSSRTFYTISLQPPPPFPRPSPFPSEEGAL